MQTESGMQLILLGGPPLESETLMGLSIDGVSRMRQVVFAPVSGTTTQTQQTRPSTTSGSLYSARFVVGFFFASFTIYPPSNWNTDLKGGEMFR